ncbi:hypothetical protein Tco_1073886 [Tanacetum coccineum]
MVVCFHCPFVVLNGYHDDGGNRLTKTSLITYLRDRHCNGNAQAITRQYLSTNLTHNIRSKCGHGKGSDFVSPFDCGDLRCVLYDIIKAHISSSSDNFDHVAVSVLVQHGNFTLALLDSLFSKGLCTVKSIPPKCRLGFSRVLKESLEKVMRETLAKSSHPLSGADEEDLDLVKVLSSSGAAHYNDVTHEDLKIKHHFKPAPSLPHIPINHHHLVASPNVVLDRIKSFPRGASCGRDGLCVQHLMDCLSRATVVTSNDTPLTPLVKLGGGIRPIAVGGGDAILHVMNRLIEGRGDDIGLSMLLVDFKNAFNLVDQEAMLQEVRLRCPTISSWVEFLLHPLICKIKDSFSLSLQAWYLDDGTTIGDTLVVGKALELIIKDGPSCGLHLNVDKTKIFWPKEDPRSRLAGAFPPNIGQPLHGVKLLGRPASVDFNFSSELVMKRAVLMDSTARINDPQCELLLLRACAERIITTSGPCFGDWQWRLSTLPFAFGGLGVFSVGDVLNYAFLASKLQFATLWLCAISDGGSHFCLAYGSFDFCLGTYYERVFTGYIYGDHVVSCVGIIGIKHRHNVVRDTLVHICFWSGILTGKEVDIRLGSSPLTQTGMVNFVVGRAVTDAGHRKRVKYETKCSDIGYGFLPFSFSSLGELEKDAVALLNRILKFSVTQDIGAHVSAHTGKEVDIGLDGGRDKPLRPADMLLYSWDGGLDVCVDLTGSSSLTQTGMVDFIPGQAMIDAAQRKRGKYMAKCAIIGYGFLPFFFLFFGGIRDICGYIAEADPKVLHGLGYWGACCCSYI